MRHHDRLVGLFEDNTKDESLVKSSHFSKNPLKNGYQAPSFIIAQNKMSKNGFKEYLNKEYWTILEAIHVLSGMGVSVVSSLLLTQRYELHYYRGSGCFSLSIQ